MRKKSGNAGKQIENLGMRIRYLRKEKGYTNADIFAYENNMDRSQYGKYERGYDVTFSTIIKICEFHKISIKDFFSEGFDDIELIKKEDK